MKSYLPLIFGFGWLFVAPVLLNATVERTVEKTTTYKGIVSDVNPTSSTIIMKSETTAAPTSYTYNKETVFMDSQGKVVTYEAIDADRAAAGLDKPR